MNAGDWINVANAFGTSAAAVIALWLGLHAHSRTSADEIARARLFAARVSARLGSTAEKLRLHTALSGFADVEVSEEQGVMDQLQGIAALVRTDLYFPDDAALIALTPLPNRCAHRIARAADYVDRVRAQVPTLPLRLMSFGGDADSKRKMLQRWVADLDAAASLLSAAIAECIAAADLGAPMPSAEEIYGPLEDRS